MATTRSSIVDRVAAVRRNTDGTFTFVGLFETAPRGTIPATFAMVINAHDRTVRGTQGRNRSATFPAPGDVISATAWADANKRHYVGTSTKSVREHRANLNLRAKAGREALKRSKSVRAKYGF